MKYLLFFLLFLGLVACDNSPVEQPVAGAESSFPTAITRQRVATFPPTPQRRPTEQAPTQTIQPIIHSPLPAPPPHQPTGVGGNPWGYAFDPGSLIYTPVPGFCSGQYFSCTPSFAQGIGYVVECQDRLYAKSGGRPGSCSHHGGDRAILYAHYYS